MPAEGYLFGAICPARGVGSALVLPIVNVQAMNKHLAEISTCVTLGAIAVLVIDGAGWHRSPKLDVPDNIVLLTLPPYAPELNPVENIWAYLRANKFGHQVWETYEAILDATCAAWNALTSTPDIIRSTGYREWAEVKIQGRWYNYRRLMSDRHRYYSTPTPLFQPRVAAEPHKRL